MSMLFLGRLNTNIINFIKKYGVQARSKTRIWWSSDKNDYNDYLFEGELNFQSLFDAGLVEESLDDTVPQWNKQPYKVEIGAGSVENPLTSINENIFFNISNLTEVSIPRNIVDVKYCAFNNCNNIKTITIQNSETNIALNAFNDCSSVLSVTIPQTMCSVQLSSFFNTAYQNIENISISEGVANIGDIAFYNCKNLKSIYIPDSVTNIGISAFCKTMLSSVTIPDSVVNINRNAFTSCSKLKNIIFGKCSADISTYVFSYCNALTAFIVDNDIIIDIQQLIIYYYLKMGLHLFTE